MPKRRTDDIDEDEEQTKILRVVLVQKSFFYYCPCGEKIEVYDPEQGQLADCEGCGETVKLKI